MSTGDIAVAVGPVLGNRSVKLVLSPVIGTKSVAECSICVLVHHLVSPVVRERI